MGRPRPTVLIDAHAPDDRHWQDYAICTGSDPAIFYPEGRAGTNVAIGICHGCPVRAECLEYALVMGEKFGIWGGTSEHERRRIAKSRRLHAA